MYPFFSTLIKLSILSLIVGAALSFVNINAEDILGLVGLSPLQIWIYLLEFRDWAIPNMILGAVIVIPIWFVIYFLQPPSSN